MKRGSGILLHLTSLPSRFGIGDLGPSAYAFADRLAASNQSYWQILPLNPTHEGAGNSPYFSAGALAVNPLLISPEGLVEEGLLEPEALEDAPEWPEDEVDFSRVGPWKQGLLRRAVTRFEQREDLQDAFRQFCEANREWLDDFALFMVIKQQREAGTWTAWPEALRQREPAALAEEREANAADLRRFQVYQFLFYRQWRRLKRYCNDRGIQLIGDVPIYVALDSADVWAHPRFFKLDGDGQPTAVSGVPPDYFSATGQLWNTPVYNWETLRNEGYVWWKQRMRQMFDLYDIVRIDHFRGLVQYWEIPAGEPTAIHGTWQDVPSYDFFDALRAEFEPFRIIAEDLGIITDDVLAVMRHYDFPGMKVLLFAFGEDSPGHPYLPHNYPRSSVAYTGTHDTNTFVGWWEHEAGEEDRARVFRYLGGAGTVDEARWDTIRLALASVADLAMLPLQDLVGLGASARMNDPSTAAGNWKWRCSESVMQRVDWARLAEMAWVYGRA